LRARAKWVSLRIWDSTRLGSFSLSSFCDRQNSSLEGHLFIMTNVGNCFGVSRELAAHDSSHEASQAVWFAKLASLDGLDHDH
jgi:hypothetical protein